MKYTKRLYDLRIDHDKTQEEIAKMLKTTKQNYSRYENGKRQIPIDVLIELSRLYETSVDYILGETDETKPYRRNNNGN